MSIADEKRMRDYLEAIANCPCCQQSIKCERGCTFADDCPTDYAKIVEIRRVLTGKK